MENTCKNCGNIHTLSYCNRCGQIVINERFTTKKLLKDVFTKVLDLDRGLFFTMYSVLIRPQVVIKEYISGATRKYTNPAKFALYLIAIATFLIVRNNNLDRNVQDINNAFSLNDQHGMELQKVFVGFIKEYMQYFTLLFIPFFALSTKWLFRSFNYAEHLILQCYVYGILAILCLPFSLFAEKTSFAILLPIAITVLFYSYTFRKLFSNSIFMSVVKGILSYLIGYILFMLTIFIGTFAFLIAKWLITGNAF